MFSSFAGFLYRTLFEKRLFRRKGFFVADMLRFRNFFYGFSGFPGNCFLYCIICLAEIVLRFAYFRYIGFLGLSFCGGRNCGLWFDRWFCSDRFLFPGRGGHYPFFLRQGRPDVCRRFWWRCLYAGQIKGDLAPVYRFGGNFWFLQKPYCYPDCQQVQKNGKEKCCCRSSNRNLLCLTIIIV